MTLEELDNLLETKQFDFIKKKYEKLLKRFDKVLAQADAQQLQVIKMAEKLKLLLDNTSDGFLQFDENMIIDSEYSKQVEVIFKQNVKHKNITSLLYPNDLQKASKLQENLVYILDNPSQADLIFSLLPKEFFINNRYIEIEYKLLPERKFMLILKDITEKKELQSKIDKENQILKMVVEVVINKEQFLELKNRYIKFVNNIEKYDPIFLKREIHTFKGLFSQKEFLTLPKKLHQLESNLQNIDKKEMLEWLEEDLTILKNILGEEFFNTNYILIDKDRLENIIKEIKKSTNNKEILEKIESLKYFNISSYLRQYKNLLEQLSVRLEKPLEVVFDIEDIYLSDKFKPFLDSLIHIFRNSIDHGIESLEERIIKDKKEIALIKCKVYQKDFDLIIEISDDGRGIDIDKIREKIVKQNILSSHQIDFLSDEMVLGFIFEDGFSSKEKVNSLSGRGVGLSVVKSELDKLHGSVDIELKNGTKFLFKIPLDLNKSILYFLKECKVVENFLKEKFQSKKVKFHKLENCFMIDVFNDSKLVITSNMDKERLKELLNIIAGYFIKRFRGDISVPYEKCIDENVDAIEYVSKRYQIIVAFKG